MKRRDSVDTLKTDKLDYKLSADGLLHIRRSNRGEWYATDDYLN